MEYSKIQINEEKYEIGSLTVETCENAEFPNINIGSSPFSKDPEIFSLMISNNETNEVLITNIKYILNGKTIHAVTNDVTILGNQEKDISFFTKFSPSSKNITIKPLITYTYKGKQYIDMPPVATEYTTELSKDNIIKYIEEQGKR